MLASSLQKPLMLMIVTISLVGCATAPERMPTEPSPAPTPSPTPSDPSPRTTVPVGTAIPESALELLKRREGSRNVVYIGHNGKPTAGVGHVLFGRELTDYPVDSSVPAGVIRQWLEADTKGSWDAAIEQANTIKDARLAEPLFAVNYQLGVNWHSIHRNTWALLKQQDWDGVSAEIETSLWCRQTPLRCDDFNKALRAL